MRIGMDLEADRGGFSNGVARPTPELLAAIVDHVREAVCLTTADLDGGPHIVHVNPAYTAITGYALEEVVGRTPRILQGPATDRTALASLKQGMREGRRVSADVVNYRRDGSALLMRISVVPILDRAGAVTHYLGLLRDAAEERAAEVTGQIFRAALEQATDALAILDERGNVSYANSAALALACLSASRILGRSARASGLTPRRLRVYREILTALSVGREWRGEYESSGRWGEPRRLDVSVTRVDTGDPHASYVVDARDVTHQRRLEYIAEATNLVENVGYVFAGLRHELGNPINSIKTALTVLRQNLWTMPRERAEDYLDRVLLELGRVEYLLRSLQSFNTLHRTTLETVPIAPFLKNFARMVAEDVSRRGVSLAVEVDDDVGAAIADPRALHQVMLNLVTNALDALAGRRQPLIRLAAQRGASHLRLTVSDNGPGIPPGQRDRLFKPFHTTKPKGTGLGLAITRKLITLMRGTIDIDAGLGWATTFTVTLDAAGPPDLQRRFATQRPPPRISR
jgi:PAS domain S-box-containing protein